MRTHSGHRYISLESILLISVLMLLSACATSPKSQMTKFANSLCHEALNSKNIKSSFGYNDLFTKSFKDSLPEQQYAQMMQQIITEHGSCQKITQITEQGIINVLTKSHNNLSFELRLNNNHDQIQGLFFHGPKNDLNRFRQAAQWICSDLLISNPEFNYADHFHGSFRKAINYKKLVAISRGIFKKFGKCMDIQIPVGALVKQFFTIGPNGKKLIFDLVVVEENGKNLIKGLLFKGEKTEPIQFNSKKEIKAHLEKLPGKINALIITESEAKNEKNKDAKLSFNSNKTHAIGSIFKLHVLGALAEQIEKNKIKWDQYFPIKGNLKSLPSGVMQNYRKGKMVSLYELAAKMISISDNTATDHLIDILGRENIEDFIQNNKFIKETSNYKPLLYTRELFAARAFFSNKDYQSYSKENRKKRLNRLNRYTSKSPAKIMQSLKNWSNPKGIEELEYFASSNEVCRLMFWLKNVNDKKIKKILALNAPYANENSSFNYSGYKGGSEPGVLAMSYLLQSKNDKWSCFYLATNDEKKPINTGKFLQSAQSILLWHAKN